MIDPKTRTYKRLTGKKPINRILDENYKMKSEGSLMIWWIPQVPMNGFLFPVENIKEGKLIISCLGQYDIFQFKNKIKYDYSNASGLLVFEDNDWIEWMDSISGDQINDI